MRKYLIKRNQLWSSSSLRIGALSAIRNSSPVALGSITAIYADDTVILGS